MADYIDRDYLVKCIEVMIKRAEKDVKNGKTGTDIYKAVVETKHSELEALLAFVEQVPSVDACKVVRGKWITVSSAVQYGALNADDYPILKYNATKYKCSVCGRIENNREPYCNCGAKMDGDVAKQSDEVEWICDQLESIIPDVEWDDESVEALIKAIKLLKEMDAK